MTIRFEPHPNHLVVRGLPAASVARGGPGSGFHGHAGRPGERGGSAPGPGEPGSNENAEGGLRYRLLGLASAAQELRISAGDLQLAGNMEGTKDTPEAVQHITNITSLSLQLDEAINQFESYLDSRSADNPDLSQPTGQYPEDDEPTPP
jgi:hypothetical protein